MKNLVTVLKNLQGRTLILTHHNADVDAISSAIVLANILNADIGTPDTISTLSQKIIKDDIDRIIIKPNPKDYDNLIIVDTASIEQILPLKPEAKENILIDHHSESTLKEKVDYSFIDNSYKANCSIIFDIADRMDYKLNKVEAGYLMAGMITDTAHLKLADKKILSQLIKLMDLVGLDEILPKLTQEMDYSERIAILKSFTRLKIYKAGDHIIAISSIGSHEASSARSLVQYADIAVVIAKRKNEIRISTRGKKSLKGKIHLANDVLSKISNLIEGSGGGHDLAASANGSNPKNIKEVQEKILNEISKKLGKLSSL